MNYRMATGDEPPEAYTREEARRMIAGLSRTKFWELEKAGQIKVRRIGTKMIVLRSDLIGFLESLPTEAPRSRAA